MYGREKRRVKGGKQPSKPKQVQHDEKQTKDSTKTVSWSPELRPSPLIAFPELEPLDAERDWSPKLDGALELEEDDYDRSNSPTAPSAQPSKPSSGRKSPGNGKAARRRRSSKSDVEDDDEPTPPRVCNNLNNADDEDEPASGRRGKAKRRHGKQHQQQHRAESPELAQQRSASPEIGSASRKSKRRSKAAQAGKENSADQGDAKSAALNRANSPVPLSSGSRSLLKSASGSALSDWIVPSLSLSKSAELIAPKPRAATSTADAKDDRKYPSSSSSPSSSAFSLPAPLLVTNNDCTCDAGSQSLPLQQQSSDLDAKEQDDGLASTRVFSLVELCTQALLSNIDALPHLYSVTTAAMKPLSDGKQSPDSAADGKRSPNASTANAAVAVESMQQLTMRTPVPAEIAQRLLDHWIAHQQLTPSRLKKLWGSAITHFELSTSGLIRDDHGTVSHPDWLRLLSPFPLTHLALHQCLGVSDESFLALIKERSPMLSTLTKLTLSNCPSVTHAGLSVIAKMHNLTSLDLCGCDVRNPTLMSFVDLTRLQTLKIERCIKLSSAGLAGLAELTELKHLYLNDCTRLSATALEHVKDLTALETLKLRNLALADKSLSAIRKLVNLRHLDMYGMRNITDAGLVNLERLVRLDHLCLAQTKCTAKFLEQLPLWCPALRILHLTQVDSANEKALTDNVCRLSELTNLRMRRVHHVTDTVLTSLRHLRQLTELDVTECRKVELTGAHIKGLNPAIRVFAARSVAFTEDGFECLPMLTNLTSLDVSRVVGPSFGDYASLKALVNLTHLDLSFCDLDRSDMELFVHLPKLVRLRLKGCPAREMEGGKGIVYLSKCREMSILNMSQCNLRDNELLCFLPAMTKLTWLHLKHSPQLTSKSGAVLQCLTALTHLNLEQCIGMDDDIVPSLSTLVSLTSLDLSHIPKITHVGLVALQSLNRMIDLNITGCRVNDRALACINGMPRLQQLRVEGSLLTQGGIDTLQAFAKQYRALIKVTKTLLRQQQAIRVAGDGARASKGRQQRELDELDDDLPPFAINVSAGSRSASASGAAGLDAKSDDAPLLGIDDRQAAAAAARWMPLPVQLPRSRSKDVLVIDGSSTS